MRKGYKLEISKEPIYLLSFSIPWLESDYCYDCGHVSMYWIKKQIHLIKLGEKVHKKYLSPMDIAIREFHKQRIDRFVDLMGSMMFYEPKKKMTGIDGFITSKNKHV